MIIAIIGSDKVEYCQVKKKNLDKHFYLSRDELYIVRPDCLRPVDIFHNGAWIGSDSIIVFERNNPYPIECKRLEYYGMDQRLGFIDEHKLMSPRKKGLLSIFGGTKGIDAIVKLLPWLLIGGIFLFNWLGDKI